MRKIIELLQQYEEVWFWIDKEYQDQFFKELIDLNVIFTNGAPVARGAIRHCMGVDNKKTVGYLSNMVWFNSFSHGNPPLKVNYGKYINGEDDYVFLKSNIQPIDIDELMEGRNNG